METNKHGYVISSERGFEDETYNVFYSNKEYNVGDTVVLDGIRWTINEVM